MTDSRIGITLEARNRASGAINDVKKSLTGLDGAAGVATRGLAGLAGAFGAGALLTLGSSVGQAVVQMATLAENAARTRRAFEELAEGAGSSATQMLSALKQASAGGISEANLMLAANKAMMLGVADNAEEMTALIEVAAKRGSALGLSMTQAFDNLVTGVGRGSALILDNLGFSLNDINKASEALAKELGKTVEQLSDAEKKAAMLKVVMQEATTIDASDVESMVTGMERAAAAGQDLKVALGEAFGPAIAKGATFLAELLRTPVESLRESDRSRAQTSLEMVRPEIDAQIAAFERARDLFNASAPLLSPSDVQANVERISQMEEALRGLLTIWNNDAWSVGAPQFDIDESIMQGVLVARDQVLAAQTEMAAGAQTVVDTYAGVGDAIEREVSGAVSRVLGQMGALDAYRFGENLRGTLTAIATDAQAAGQPFELLRLRLMEASDANVLFAQTMNEVPPAVETAAASVDRAERSIRLLGGTLDGVQGSLVNTAVQVWNLAGSFLDLAANATQSALTVGKAFGLAQKSLAVGQGAFQREIDELTGALSKPDAIGLEPLRLGFDEVRVGAKQTIPAIEELGGAGYRAGSSIATGMSDANRAAQGFYDTIEGKVKGVLTDALNVDVGVNPDDFMPRPDAVNENARRLADIMVNGFKGQDWLEEFRAEVPDLYQALAESGDPRATAAQMLKDFQEGLVPDLIDRDAAKERVRRMLLGEQNAASMAREIASELATEMGISLGEATQAAQAALGVALPGGSAPKGEQGIALNGTAEGDQFVTGLLIAITARTAEMRANGATVGGQWGAGFLEAVGGNVPGALVSLLVSAVLSGVSSYNSQTRAD